MTILPRLAYLTYAKASDDPILNGLDTASVGAPIELKLDFSTQGTNLSMYASKEN